MTRRAEILLTYGLSLILAPVITWLLAYLLIGQN